MHFSSIKANSSNKKPIHSSLLQNFVADKLQIRKLHWQWQQSWNWFFALEASKSCVSYEFSLLRSYFLYCCCFSRLLSRIKNEVVTKTDQFCTAQRQVENCASKSDRICNCLIWVRHEHFSYGKLITGQQYYERRTLLILFGNTSWINVQHQHVHSEDQQSVKHSLTQEYFLSLFLFR